MYRKKKIKIPIYGVSFNLVIYNEPSDMMNVLPKGFEWQHDPEDWDGGVYRVNGNLYLALRDYDNNGYKYPTPGIISHECKHLVNDVFMYIGQKLDPNNDEAECYLLQWLVNRTHEFLNEKQ